MPHDIDAYNNRSFLASSFLYIACIIGAIYCGYCRLKKQKMRRMNLGYIQQQQQSQANRSDNANSNGTTVPVTSSYSSMSLGLSGSSTASVSAAVAGERDNQDVLRETIFEKKRDRLDAFPTHIAFAFSMRVLWLYLNAFGRNDDQTSVKSMGNTMIDISDIDNDCQKHSGLSALNRFSQLIYFLAFSTVLTFWSESLYFYHMQQQSIQSELSNALSRSSVNQFIAPISNGADSSSSSYRQHDHGIFTLLKSPRSLFLIFNFWALIMVIILHMVQFFDAGLCDTFHEIETVAIAIFFIVLAVGFIWIGTQLRHELIEINKNNDSRKINKIIWRTTVISIVSSMIFVLRATLFLIRPLTGYRFVGISGMILYPWFFYQVPEIIPCAIVLYFITPKWSSTYSSNSQFLDQAHQPLIPRSNQRNQNGHSSNNVPVSSAWI